MPGSASGGHSSPPRRTSTSSPPSPSAQASASQPYAPLSASDSPDLGSAPFTPPNPLSQSAGRRGHGRQQSSLGSGTHLLRSHAEGGDLGGWTLEDAEERRARDKGKGRGLQPAAVIGEEPDEIDSEAERERIAAHLAQWSSTEKKRRATRRKNTQLVLPSAPVTTAQISQLSRSGSQLLRRPSQAAKAARAARQRSKSFTQVAGDEYDDETSADRGRSVRLLDRSRTMTDGSTASPEMPPLPSEYQAAIDGVIDLNAPPKKPTLVTALPRRTRSQSPPPNSAASDATIGGASNPFASPTKHAHQASRFLEDLPPQSPVKERSSESHARPSADLGHVGDATPRASFDDLLGSPRNNGLGTPGMHSIRNPFTDAAEVASLKPSIAHSAASFNQALNGGGGVRGQPQPTRMRSWVRQDSYRDDGSYAGGGQEEEEERDDDTRGTVGILDWLLCGCFRGSEDNEGHQAGRTNPNE